VKSVGRPPLSGAPVIAVAWLGGGRELDGAVVALEEEPAPKEKKQSARCFCCTPRSRLTEIETDMFQKRGGN
jgi:hypothetical protein